MARVIESGKFGIGCGRADVDLSRSPLRGIMINHLSPRVAALYPSEELPQRRPSQEDVSLDIDCLISATNLQTIRRYYGQKFWHEESVSAQIADQIEAGLKLENVAAHSWQVADAVLLLGPHFPELPQDRCLRLAVLHDKLEILTGDYDPVGQKGDGMDSHAFNPNKRWSKHAAELEALERYLGTLRPALRETQRSELLEYLDGRSPAARFVKAVDKLQALVFVLIKKRGKMSNAHLAFSVRYSFLAIEYFAPLRHHHLGLLARLLESIANFRDVPVEQVETELWDHLSKAR